MSSFPDELVEDRAQLRAQVDQVLRALREGGRGRVRECQQVDLKEEPGRRVRGGGVLPGDTQNPAAVEMLSREVPCMANTPGGGALVLGVADDGRVVGTELDADWLRHRVFERVEVAPAVEEHRVDGERVLVLYVAESREPVEDPDRKLRWRVGEHCVPVDRSEWWLRRAERAGLDPMAAASRRTIADVSVGALLAARRYLASVGEDDLREASDQELLRRLGALRPDGHLTQAGALVFCPSPRGLLMVTRFDVVGGEVVAPPPDFAGLALLEQVAATEDRLDAWNPVRTVRRGFVDAPVRELPPSAVREAVLNGLVHRDWLQSDPTTVTWFAEDRALEVVSPGGFVGGVSAENVLTQRYARYPALSDLFRALRLVDKQGVGVDRMYREMIALGHRPPRIVADVGPRVRTRLVGGEPVVPVMVLIDALRPAVRQRDVRIAVLLYELLREPFVTDAGLASALQCHVEDAREVLVVARRVSVGDAPLLESYKDVWLLSKEARDLVARAAGVNDLSAHGLLAYRRPERETAVRVVRRWLACHDRMTSRDYATLTGLSAPGAAKALERLVPEVLARGGPRTGRGAHYRLA